MGILYNSVMAHQELKRKFVLERLLEAGVTKSRDGIDIHKCDYETLKYEWVLQGFREAEEKFRKINVESDKNQWF